MGHCKSTAANSSSVFPSVLVLEMSACTSMYVCLCFTVWVHHVYTLYTNSTSAVREGTHQIFKESVFQSTRPVLYTYTINVWYVCLISAIQECLPTYCVCMCVQVDNRHSHSQVDHGDSLISLQTKRKVVFVIDMSFVFLQTSCQQQHLLLPLSLSLHKSHRRCSTEILALELRIMFYTFYTPDSIVTDSDSEASLISLHMWSILAQPVYKQLQNNWCT